MSLNDFFETRYFIPGIVYIMFFLCTGYPSISVWIGDTYKGTVDVGIALIPFFVGTPLGFLLSQIWYTIIVHNNLIGFLI